MKRILVVLMFVPVLLSAQNSQKNVTVLTDAHQSTISGNSQQLVVQNIALKTGVRLQYVEQGSKAGVPVIFLHGLGDSWHSFETVLSHLPGHMHAFALSQRGHGDSERPAEGYTPKHFADDVFAFVTEKQLGPVVIVGHSMGGVIAQRFALDYPGLTKALVIIGSDAAVAKNPGLPEFYEVAMKLQDPIDKTFMTEFQRGCLAKPIDSSYFDLLVAESLKVPVKVFQAALKGLIDADFTEELKKMQQPTLVFWGTMDAFFAKEGQKKLAANIARHTSLHYDGGGHSLHWEEPKSFASDLLKFISEEVK